MSFPEKEELILKKSMQQGVTPIIEFIKERATSPPSQKELDNILEEYVDKFIDDLTSSVADFTSFTKEDWEKIFKETLPSPLNEKATSKWLMENLTIYANFPEKAVTKLDKIRYNRVEDTRLEFNKRTGLKLSKDSFNKSDINYLKRMLDTSPKIKELKGIRIDLDNLKNFTKQDMENLTKWANRYSELWARDQAGDLYAMQCEEMAILTGTEEFIWNTEKDSRVRPRHRELEGRRLKFATAKFLPGQEALCRCHMTPIKKSHS